MNSKVFSLVHQGKYTKALSVAKETLRVAETSFGPEDPKVARSLCNLAEIYEYQGKYAEAEPLYKHAVAIDEKTLGPDHPRVDVTLTNLANVLKTQGKYAELEPIYQRILDIREKNWGPNDGGVVRILEDYAALLRETNRTAETEKLESRVSAIEESSAFPEAAEEANPPSLQISDDPLTAEQVAIYHAVIEYYSKGHNIALNLTAKTEMFVLPKFPRTLCKEFDLKSAESSDSVVHRLDSRVLLGPKMVLVDPERQQELIDKNDPQKLVKKAIDDHEKVTNKQLGNSVKRAFESGMLTLSEIMFDKQHRRALVNYSFVCGMLCGNGAMLMLEKVGENWKVSEECSTWVS
jgi:tetratricopeptide (TPR) repeat protein